MKTKRTEQDLIDAARRELDSSCDRLDGQTLSRLNRIRHEALEQRAQAKRHLSWFPARGLVSACIVLIVVSVWTQRGPDSALDMDARADSASLEDLEILISADSIEFYEDFEFYQWLAENESSV